MTSTVEQNRKHRTDSEWIKSPGKSFQVHGETYLAEYANVFTGFTILKDWRMTGQDWVIFDASGQFHSRAHSLTAAKVRVAGEPTYSDMMSDLVDAVVTNTGYDPNIEREYEGTAIAPCEDCGKTTAVTTMLLGQNGDRRARVGVCCMWND